MKYRCQIAWIIFILCVTTANVMAQTGLPLPRFVSLKSDKVNLRYGPGDRYPIQWELVYRNMPVEIIDEFKNWRKVREWLGSVGWVHKSLLSGQRWVIIKEGLQTLRRSDKLEAPKIAKIQKKVIGRLKKCTISWCKIDFSGQTGWMQHSQIWGVYPGEIFK